MKKYHGHARGYLWILVIQEETQDKFGEIAVRKKYLTKEQVDELLREQSDSYLYFGDALVRIGVITQETLTVQLREYHALQKIT